MIFVLFVTLIVIFIYLIYKSAEYGDAIATTFGIVGFVLVTLILPIVLDSQPKAMDVYQGKTTLEITYRDGVAVDSCVIFKDK